MVWRGRSWKRLENPSTEKAEGNCTRAHYNGSLSGSKATTNKQVTSKNRQARNPTTPLLRRGLTCCLTLLITDINVFHLLSFRAIKALVFPT